MSVEQQFLKRVQRRAIKTIGETEATQPGKEGGCWGLVSVVLPQKMGSPFLSAQQARCSQHSRNFSREERAAGVGTRKESEAGAYSVTVTKGFGMWK